MLNLAQKHSCWLIRTIPLVQCQRSPRRWLQTATKNFMIMLDPLLIKLIGRMVFLIFHVTDGYEI